MRRPTRYPMIISLNVYLLYGKAHTRQLLGILIAASGIGHTGKQITPLDAVIHMHKVRLKSGS